jgi:hypothetical protein
MTHASLAEAPSTSIMLSMLLARWQKTPRTENAPAGVPAEALERARSLIVQTVGHYVDYLDPADQALYTELVSSPDARSIRERFFGCFDLLVRTRGAALAVLRLHELHRLLR